MSWYEMLAVRINIHNDRVVTGYYTKRLNVEAPTLALYCVSKSTLAGLRLPWQNAGPTLWR